jgi:protein O-GlcNAc transferase
LLDEAGGLSRSGRPDHALPVYDRILASYPRHAAAHRDRGNALADLGHLDQALASFERAITLDPGDAECHDYHGIALARTGRMAEAAASLERAIALQPDNANALGNRGIVLMHLNRLDEALASLDGAIALFPQHVAAYANRGNLLLRLNRPDEALASYDRALALDPNNVDAHFNRGVALAQVERPEEAVASYERALALAPDHVDALNNRGTALAGLGRSEEAFESYRRALALAPQHPPVLFNLGELLHQFGRFEEAERCYGQAVAAEPGHVQARFRQAVTLTDLQQFGAAAACYERLVALAPNLGHAFNNLGFVQHKLGRIDEALANSTRAAALIPDSAEVWLNLAAVRSTHGDPQGAIADADRALALDPTIRGGVGMRLTYGFDICDWHDADRLFAILEEQIAAGVAAAAPFQLLALKDDPALQRAGAELYAHALCPPSAAPAPPCHARGERFRIGYFSADFHEHATMRLLAEMIEAHDRSRFELIGFSFGPDQQDRWRARAVAAMDRFIDVSAMTDRAVAELARTLKVDIAIDLKGFTKHFRMGIFAERAAPIQAAFLGFPGTSGTPYIDYFIADPIVVPEGCESSFTEKILRLPGSYQPNCRSVAVEPFVGGRAALGLPEDVIVYCCFNQNYKITPTVLDGWLRILARVERSLLWLWADRDVTRANLRAYAAAAGLDPDRLVFASRLPAAAHLARLPLADLFLDTSPYGAHTTASDALRMGLPVLTAPGASFVSRVAASLLHALDLPELVAADRPAYERRAIELGEDRAQLAAIRRKLAANIDGAPLFDPADFARKIERGYVAIYERCEAGRPPDHLTLDA